MRLVRPFLVRASILAFVLVLPSACESGFLDPALAGTWGGQGLEVTISADLVTAKHQCGFSEFPGDIRLGEQREFQRDGFQRTGSGRTRLRLSAWLPHPDTMNVVIYEPGDPLADPAVVPVVRGRAATWNELILCAE